MGLDQFAYCGRRTENNAPREIMYWRKHPSLQGWMEQLWVSKGKVDGSGQEDDWGSEFNGVELELTWDDLDALEKDIKSNNLPKTSGFFFGTDSSEYYKEADLQFVIDAKAEVFLGLTVFYNSSW